MYINLTRFFIIIFVFTVVLPFNILKGQITTFYEGDYKPAIVWVYPQDNEKEVYQKIKELKDYKRKQFHWLLLSDSLKSKEVISKKINDFLNSELTIEKQRVYFLEWGKEEKSNYFIDKNTDIIADFYYKNITQGLENFDLGTVLQNFEKNYIWGITLSDIEEKSLLNKPQIKKFNIGFVYGSISNGNYPLDSAYIPSNISSIGLNFGYRVNPRFYILTKTSVSFKLPNQSQIQSELFSQIDIGSSGVQKVSIDMKAHVFGQLSIQGQYFLTKSQKFKPFVAGGLGLNATIGTRIRQETEIDLSSITAGGGPPAGGFGDLGGDLGADGALPFNTTIAIQPVVSTGFWYALSKNVNIISSVEYNHNSKKEMYGVKLDQRPKNISFNLGFQFEFNKRQRKYYQYFE